MDKDEGVNAEKIFLIAEGNEKGIFQLDLQSGDLSLKPGLDPVKVAGRYNLKLEVSLSYKLAPFKWATEPKKSFPLGV